MKKYEDLILTLIRFTSQDVITGSLQGENGTYEGSAQEPTDWD